jgi:hypothetical protein
MPKKTIADRPIWVQEMHHFLNKRPGKEAPLRLVKEHGMGFVPPGPAWREGDAKRKTDARYRGAGDDVPKLENLRVVRNGSARIVLKAIWYEVNKARTMEKFERGGRLWLRLLEKHSL